MSHILRTSTERKTASLADEGNSAYFQSSGAHKEFYFWRHNKALGLFLIRFIFKGRLNFWRHNKFLDLFSRDALFSRKYGICFS